jgi:hypothetical protein
VSTATDCARCGHSSDWHHLEGTDPTSPDAKFYCLGYDCTVSGPWIGTCDCPDFEE